MKQPGWVPPFFPHSYRCYHYSCNSKGRQVLGIKREVCKSGRRKTITEDPGYTLGCMQGWTPGLPTPLGGQVHFYSSLWYCMKTVDHSGAHSGQTTYTCVRRCVGPSWLRVLRSAGGCALLIGFLPQKTWACTSRLAADAPFGFLGDVKGCVLVPEDGNSRRRR